MSDSDDPEPVEDDYVQERSFHLLSDCAYYVHRHGIKLKGVPIPLTAARWATVEDYYAWILLRPQKAHLCLTKRSWDAKCESIPEISSFAEANQ